VAAKVNGARLASALSKPTLGAILDHAGDVMRDALDQGGTSFDSMYVNVNGESVTSNARWTPTAARVSHAGAVAR